MTTLALRPSIWDTILKMASFISNGGLTNLTSAWHAYASRPLHIGWGTGSGAAVTANNLTTPSAEARVAGTSSQQTTTTTGDTYRVVGTLTASAPRVITEVGVFDAAGTGSPPAGGNMGLYGDFAAVNLGAGDGIAFTINTVFDQAP